MGFWGWLKNRVKAAFLAGVQEAVDELQTADLSGGEQPVKLRLTFRPADEPEQPSSRKRKEA